MIIPDILELKQPLKPLPLIFDSPHSGMIIPEDFHYTCDAEHIKRAADLYIDDLFSAAPDHGAYLLNALFPRAYIDVNRARDDIDPDLYDGEWQYTDTTPANPTNRSYAGIGLIRRLIKPNTPVYDHPLSQMDIKSRIETCYDPYHTLLEKTLDETHHTHGKFWHINCHSMPSVSLTSGALGRINPLNMPDFVLGNRDGTSCDIDFTHALRDFIKSMGYKVAINTPYKGVELVERYSNPTSNRHSIQIEICKALYLNEQKNQKSKNHEKFKGDITKLIKFCGEYVNNKLT